MQPKITPIQIDTVVGSWAAGGGSTALLYQIQQTVSLITLGLNLLLAVAGLYLLYIRIKRLKNKDKEG